VIGILLLTLFFNLVLLAYEYFGNYQKTKRKRLITTIFFLKKNRFPKRRFLFLKYMLVPIEIYLVEMNLKINISREVYSFVK